MLLANVYVITSTFPKEELYGLSSQIKRAVVSIASNIAEGAGRNSNKEFIHFLSIANGSAYELQTQLVIAHKLNLINNEKLELAVKQIEEVIKMNRIFQKRLQST